MNMNKWLLLSIAFGVMPWSVSAQDDMYFVPSKKSATTVTSRSSHYNGEGYRMPRDTYYSGSNRSIDDYNRRSGSHYEVVSSDTTGNDIIDFTAVEGVYPDSTMQQDFALTREMTRWDGYEPEESYWDGYEAGRRDGIRSAWRSPWYYSSYYSWYDPWYYDPWYYGYYGYPGYYGYYGWYRPWYYGTYWDWEYYHYGYYYPNYYYGGWSTPRHNYAIRTTGNTGTIDRRGTTHGRFIGSRGPSTSGSSSRFSTARNRTIAGHNSYGTSERSVARSASRSGASASGNFRGARSTSNNSFSSVSNSSYSTPSTSFRSSPTTSSSTSSGSFSGSFSGSRSSSGGGFSGGGSRGGGGGGGGVRMGGRR